MMASFVTEFKHLEIQPENIKSATNNFSTDKYQVKGFTILSTFSLNKMRTFHHWSDANWNYWCHTSIHFSFFNSSFLLSYYLSVSCSHEISLYFVCRAFDVGCVNLIVLFEDRLSRFGYVWLTRSLKLWVNVWLFILKSSALDRFYFGWLLGIDRLIWIWLE